MSQSNQRDRYSEQYLEALIDLAASDPASEPLPEALASKVIADGKQMVGRQTERNLFAVKIQRWWQQPWLAWGVALASLVLALSVNLGGDSPRQLDDVTAVDQFVATQRDAIKLAWSGLGDPRFDRVAGYVHWSDRAQLGVMQLRGLPVNDPEQAQYQLWIVDPTRDANPVDGGVFNVTDGENLIAIDAKLAVNGPKAFAITLEQPGGVVVSAGPLLVIASG